MSRSTSRNEASNAHKEPAANLPIAQVCVDTPLPHLDRLFDYLIPVKLDEQVMVGSRVRVRFSGNLVDGYVIDRISDSDHPGKLAFISRIISPEATLTPELIRLTRHVADRYAGTLADVLRLAIPPRHAQVEREASGAKPDPIAADELAATVASPQAGPQGWGSYRTGAGFMSALAAGRPVRAVWTVLPNDDWTQRLAEALAATVLAGKGAIAVVPDARDVARLDNAVTAILGADHHVVLSAALGPRERYRRWLRVRRGQVRCVIGTRAAAFAPVAALGLVAIWDDGDDLHAEQRAPYCHAREVLLVRAQLIESGVLIGGYARTPEAQLLLDTGWAHPIIADRVAVRQRAPRVTALGEDAQLAEDAAAASARLPSVAWRAARAALAADTPVLVQVPRRGYAPMLACLRCRTPARCPVCAGPLELGAHGGVAACRWCGRLAADWACPECGERRFRATVVGARRTAEELGRAFPQVTVLTSGKDAVLDSVPDKPAIVVATPGAEPVAVGGYGAALLLDTWALLTRTELRAAQEALRRWLNAASLVRSAANGGHVVITADGALSVVQALLRWDPAWFAEHELAERTELGFPPAVRMAKLTGSAASLAELLELAELPTEAQVLGPVPLHEQLRGHAGDHPNEAKEQVLIRVPRSVGLPLAKALSAATRVRSARKSGDPVHIEIDPIHLS